MYEGESRGRKGRERRREEGEREGERKDSPASPPFFKIYVDTRVTIILYFHNSMNE